MKHKIKNEFSVLDYNIFKFTVFSLLRNVITITYKFPQSTLTRKIHNFENVYYLMGLTTEIKPANIKIPKILSIWTQNIVLLLRQQPNFQKHLRNWHFSNKYP